MPVACSGRAEKSVRMKKTLALIALCAAGYFAWQKLSPSGDNALEPLYDKPYVVVYGRDGCGLTQNCLKSLRAQGIDAVYEIIDEQEVADEIHARMQKAGLDTRRYGLPVVDVNGRIFIRPALGTVLEAYTSCQEE